MMLNNSVQVLKAISSLIEEWDDKLNGLLSKYGDNAAFGTIAMFVLIALGLYLIAMFAKK